MLDEVLTCIFLGLGFISPWVGFRGGGSQKLTGATIASCCCMLLLNEIGCSKETTIASLWVKREKFIPNCQGFLPGKQEVVTGERFPGGMGKGSLWVGWN